MTKITGRNMVRAMGMGMRLLELFEKEIQEQEGNSEILAFLTKPRYGENLQKIVHTMVRECDWRIPASEMRHRAEQTYRKDYRVDSARLDEVRNLWWTPVLIDLGIPYRRFSDDPGHGEPVIHSSLRSSLHSRKMSYPFHLDYNGEDHVLVDFGYHGGVLAPAVGVAIHGDAVEYVALAKAKYFDFDK